MTAWIPGRACEAFELMVGDGRGLKLSELLKLLDAVAKRPIQEGTPSVTMQWER